MKIKEAIFVKSAVRPKDFPPGDLPEVAFAGRSNVGKSSLINALLQRRKLVKTSQTPGKTQLINFFKVNGQMYLVDLPGYGYAKVPVSVRESWKPMVERYLSTRKNLRSLVMLMDIRRDPKQEEYMLLQSVPYYAVIPILVATKVDKLGKNERFRRKQSILRSLSCAEQDIVFFSARTGEGRMELWNRLAPLLGIDLAAEGSQT